MNFERINKKLRGAMEAFPHSLEIDRDTLRNTPWLVQAERTEFAKAHPVLPPEKIKVFDLHIISAYDNHPIRLHVYQHKEKIANRVILYFHGGGYVFGLPEQADEQMNRLCVELGATIVSVAYRLAPQYRYPTAQQDGFEALNWLISSGEKQLGISADRIVLLGASAGGHLAGAVAQMAADQGITNVSHQFLLYPVIHNGMDSASMNQLTSAPLWNKTYAEIAWGHFIGEERTGDPRPYLNLLDFGNASRLPKTTIVACELDPLRDEGIEYAKFLYENDVETELWVVPGAVHLFDIFSCPLASEFHVYLRKHLRDAFNEQ